MSNNGEKISVFIPVYRESDLLEQMLTSLLEDPYEEKEIFVVIDEPTEKSFEVSKRFSERGIHFKLNGVRRGKVNALNDAVKESKGSILLFLDSDIVIDRRGKGSFLKAVSEEMRDADIIEIRKEAIRDSFVAKISNYDYLSFSLTNLYFSKKMGRCLGINGAAFAIRREVFEGLGGFRRVICEDLDIAIRSFASGSRFKFIDSVVAYTKAPSSWREWLNQRKRWSIGAAFWVKENLRILRRAARRHPRVVIPPLFLVFPTLPLLLLVLSIFIPDDLIIRAMCVSLFPSLTMANLLISSGTIMPLILPILKGASAVLGGFIGYMVAFYLVAKKMRFSFSPLEFALFYFIMAPLWLLLIIISLVKVYMRPNKVNVDWKV